MVGGAISRRVPFLLAVAAFGELSQGLSTSDVLERINRHFGVRQAALAHADEYSSDLSLSPPSGAARAEGHAAEKGIQP